MPSWFFKGRGTGLGRLNNLLSVKVQIWQVLKFRSESKTPNTLDGGLFTLWNYFSTYDVAAQEYG